MSKDDTFERENFDHELIFDDPQALLYKEVVSRRERFHSLSRFIMQMTCFFSFVACVWISLFNHDKLILLAGSGFFFLTLLNAQVLNYRALLAHIGGESNDELDNYS